MDAGYRMTKHARAPYFARARSFKDTVTWRVTFDPDRVQSAARVFDREVQAKCSAVLSLNALPSITAQELLYRLRETVAFGHPAVMLGGPLRHQSS